MIGDECLDEDPCPCDSCVQYESCDGWAMQHCCILCYWWTDNPRCDDCNTMDI